MRPRVADLALSMALLAGTVSEAAAEAEPAGYRMDDYRGPVPNTLRGATVVDDDAAHALWVTGRVAFVDVLPRPPKPADLPEGTIWHETTRHSIPGAVWLPNVGYGRLPEPVEAYFRENLAAVTADDKDAPIVFFCLSDCWMSWNAAKRAIEEYGYTRVFWYPEGTDGWTSREWPTEAVTPHAR